MQKSYNLFDDISCDDLIVAFYPCIYFSAVSQMEFSLNCHNYKGWSEEKKIEHILDRSRKRQNMYELNDYMQNYSHLTFDEYRKLKNGENEITVENKSSKKR